MGLKIFWKNPKKIQNLRLVRFQFRAGAEDQQLSSSELNSQAGFIQKLNIRHQKLNSLKNKIPPNIIKKIIKSVDPCGGGGIYSKHKSNTNLHHLNFAQLLSFIKFNDNLSRLNFTIMLENSILKTNSKKFYIQRSPHVK